MTCFQRYAVEQNSPDGGRSCHPECWGAEAKVRARLLAETDDLRQAIIACRALSGTRLIDEWTWIWDRLAGAVVTTARIREAVVD